GSHSRAGSAESAVGVSDRSPGSPVRRVREHMDRVETKRRDAGRAVSVLDSWSGARGPSPPLVSDPRRTALGALARRSSRRYGFFLNVTDSPPKSVLLDGILGPEDNNQAFTRFKWRYARRVVPGIVNSPRRYAMPYVVATVHARLPSVVGTFISMAPGATKI